ncbi:SIR2 family protein [Streptococcus sobrinus]|uniref:SIR2 family protein n=1 Tax=Streptococcus sobrinus TaxID=1310 RepID=UPI0002F7E005|nr:SIR2 family protein [Streptococcus sobrinus]
MLQDIIEANSYPIVFIGSGISKRYLLDFPNWTDLLMECWELLEEKKNIFSFMQKIKTSPDISSVNESEKNFIVYTQTAEYIQEKFDAKFFDEELEVKGLSIKQAYTENLSPFKHEVANRFKNYKINKQFDDELASYKNLLAKAKMIVTTNYDTLIEDLLLDIGNSPQKYVGQEGFFDETSSWSELFKIHGDVTVPDSIVISRNDYIEYDKHSILISAKLLSNLIHSPIIFLGYSLTDRNVQKLLKDFASQLPDEDVRKNSDRITIVEYKKGERTLTERIVSHPDLHISYNLIETDNFKLVYDKLSSINQGLTPYEINKYESAIRNIVLTAGNKGKLDSYLISPSDIETLPEDIKDKRIVVALGDKKNIFVNPGITEYIEDYFFDDASFLPEVALRFIANEHPHARIPISKYLRNVEYKNFSFLSEKQKNKIDKRIEASTLDNIKKVPKGNRESFHSISDIINSGSKVTRTLELMSYNIDNINLDELYQYILKNVLPNFKGNYNNNAPELSAQRRLLLAYDLKKNGEIE